MIQLYSKVFIHFTTRKGGYRGDKSRRYKYTQTTKSSLNVVAKDPYLIVNSDDILSSLNVVAKDPYLIVNSDDILSSLYSEAYSEDKCRLYRCMTCGPISPYSDDNFKNVVAKSVPYCDDHLSPLKAKN